MVSPPSSPVKQRIPIVRPLWDDADWSSHAFPLDDSVAFRPDGLVTEPWDEPPLNQQAETNTSGFLAGSIPLQSPVGLVLAGLPTLLQWAQYLANCDTVLAISKAGDTGGLPMAPYVILLLTGVVWLAYGSLRKDPTVMVDSSGGVAAGVFCCWLYAQNAQHDLSMWYMLIVVCSAAVMQCMVSSRDPEWWLGKAAVLTDFVLCAAPLVVLPTVLQMHDSGSIPLMPAVVTALTSASWVSYGYLVADDCIIWVAAGAGLVSALAQIALRLAMPTH
jgi:uncharacterized protein with PQ loop repeat